jgi:hypothetical protein
MASLVTRVAQGGLRWVCEVISGVQRGPWHPAIAGFVSFHRADSAAEGRKRSDGVLDRWCRDTEGARSRCSPSDSHLMGDQRTGPETRRPLRNLGASVTYPSDLWRKGFRQSGTG